MLASFEYELSKEEYVLGLNAISRSIGSRDPGFGLRILLQVTALGLALVLGSVFFPAASDPVILTFMLTLIGGVCIQNRLARRWRDLTFDLAQAHMMLSVDDDGLRLRQPGVERRYVWQSFREVYTLPDALVIEMTDWHAVVLPRRLWATPDECAEFVSLIRDRAALPVPEANGDNTSLGATLYPMLGAGALAFIAMFLTEPMLTALGVDPCSCALRGTWLGRLVGVAPLFIFAIAFALAWIPLRHSYRRWPVLTKWLAIGCIALFIAFGTVPPAMSIMHFITSPAY